MQRRKFSREFKLEAVRLVSARPVRAPLSTITLAEQTHRPTLRAKPCTQHGVEGPLPRSEEHTSELQSLMRISYAVFCLKKKTKTRQITTTHNYNDIETTHAYEN